MIFTQECEENGVGVVKEKLPHHYKLTQKITSFCSLRSIAKFIDHIVNNIRLTQNLTCELRV